LLNKKRKWTGMLPKKQKLSQALKLHLTNGLSSRFSFYF